MCAFLLVDSLCGGEDCVCRRSRGVESHLNRRYLISATPHWRIRLLLLYALYDRYKFHHRDPYLYIGIPVLAPLTNIIFSFHSEEDRVSFKQAKCSSSVGSWMDKTNIYSIFLRSMDWLNWSKFFCAV